MTTEERTRRWVKSNLYFFIFISSYFLSIFLLKLGLKQVNKYVLDYDQRNKNKPEKQYTIETLTVFINITNFLVSFYIVFMNKVKMPKIIK